MKEAANKGEAGTGGNQQVLTQLVAARCLPGAGDIAKRSGRGGVAQDEWPPR